jgi:phospholipase/lecithinase/hemolysin
MKSRLQRFSLVTVCLALLSVGFHASSWAGVDAFDRIFFFGDSLSDAGNVYALTGESARAPYDLIPSAPYTIGGFQFSNGKTWAQRFAQSLQLNMSGKASLDAPGRNGNYAFGGARARNGSVSLAPTGQDQLNLYLADHNGAAHPDALYVVQLGGNDVRDALDLLATGDQIAAQLAIQSAITAEAGLIMQLHAKGARHFLVANVPDIGLSPAVRLAGPSAVFFATFLASSYNAGLDFALAGLQGLPGISIDRLDLFAILGDIAANPADYGIADTESACLIFYVKSGAKCSKPETYLFWDGIHPTAKVHQIVSDTAAAIYR